MVAVLLAGCGQVSNSEHDTDPQLKAVSLTNCGFDVSVSTPPERVVTIKSTSTELMLALGLGDRIVGQAFPDGPVLERWADTASQIPEISEGAPSEEVLLSQQPDFIFAGWESNLAAGSDSMRPEFDALGVATYVSPAACKEPRYQPDRMTFDLLFEQFAEVGQIFAVQPRVESLVAEQRKLLASVNRVEPGTTALWYSSGTDVPYVGAGIGAPQMVMSTLGLTNVAADVDDTWTSMSWESVVANNPDIIVLVDSQWNSASRKIAELESNPATKTMDAVRNRQYVTIPFAASEAGVRTAPSTVQLSKDINALGYN